MKRPLHAALLLATFVLASACELNVGTNDYAATDRYCGGVPSETCPLW
jgi:hypothetical protein